MTTLAGWASDRSVSEFVLARAFWESEWRPERLKLECSSPILLQIDEVLGGLMWRERSGDGFEEGSMKIPSKGIFLGFSSLSLSLFPLSLSN